MGRGPQTNNVVFTTLIQHLSNSPASLFPVLLLMYMKNHYSYPPPSPPSPFLCLLCPPASSPLSQWDFRGLKPLPLRPVTSEVTSSPSLTLTVEAALGNRQQPDLPIEGTKKPRGGQRGGSPRFSSHRLGLCCGLGVI